MNVAGVYVSIIMQGLVGVDPSAKLVAVALGDFAQVKDNGVAFPSVARLVEVTGICERQVRQHLRDLTKEQWITPEGATHGGRGMSTRYRLNLPKLRANLRKKHGDPPQGLGDDKPGNEPQGIEPVKAAVSRRVNEAMPENKPGGAASETRRCSVENPAVHRPRTGLEQVLTGFSRAPAHASARARPMLEVLNPLKKDEVEKGNGEPRNGSARPAMTQAEQLEWLRVQQAEGKA